MKQISIKILSLICAISLLFISSCKKDKDDNNAVTPAPTPAPVLTKKELLTGKYWKLTAMTVTPAYEVSPGVFVTDYYSTLQGCAKDNITFYTSNGDYIINEGPTKCQASDPQTVSGTWNFNVPETTITVLQSGTPAGTTIGGEYTIVQLDATTFKYTVDLSFPSLPTYTFTSTFTKQ